LPPSGGYGEERFWRSDNPEGVRGKVGGPAANSQTRTTELRSAGGQLEWSCTCSSDTALFCKHCVALALTVWESAQTLR